MSTMLQDKTWLTVQEVADRLGVTDGRVRQFLLEGALKGEKVGNTWVVAMQELKRFAKIERPRGNPNFQKKSR